MKPAQFNLQIEALILRNLSYAQRHRIAMSVEEELLRLCAEQGWPASLAHGGHVPQVIIDGLSFAPDARPGVIGTQIARQVYLSLSGGDITEQAWEGNRKS